ncbi:MAG: four helix bundle protein [Deltaproteobacteria bacterium RBG_16_47_11]|nr:MAG: four helix bundle protein [Deltaproteobacteria bacterium RBG_16_47_11]
MDKIDLKERTKRFALMVINIVEMLPKGRTIDVLSRQLLRSGTSVGANYRAACRAKSTADFISKMGIVEEEADETIYWMELIIEAGFSRKDGLNSLLDEANQILAITVSSIKTARKGKN